MVEHGPAITVDGADLCFQTSLEEQGGYVTLVPVNLGRGLFFCIVALTRSSGCLAPLGFHAHRTRRLVLVLQSFV